MIFTTILIKLTYELVTNLSNKRSKAMKYLFILFFMYFSNTIRSQTHTITGKVTDKETGEALLYAECVDTISKKGTTTNAFGFYSLSLPNKKIILSVSYMGYQTIKKSIYIDKDTIINIKLKPLVEQLEEVVVNKSIPIHKQTLMGKINISVSTIKAIPSFVGETDLMKSLTFLPGITNGKEGYSNIFVRGGDRGQNLVLLDGIKLYNTNHVGGFLSLFNSDILKHVDVYKGGFPARYGGRASSVIDIYTKEGNNKSFKGKFSLGLLTSSLLLEGPLKNDLSFYFAARSSYYDLFTLKQRKIYKRTGREGYWGYTIFDVNSKINWKLSETNSLSLSFYTGHDYQSSAEEVFDNNKSYGKWRIHNTGIALNQYWNLHPKWFFKNTLAFSNYKTTLESIEEGDFYYSYTTLSAINDYSLQSRLEYSPNTIHSIKFGIEANYYRFIPGLQTVISEDENSNINITTGFKKSITAFESNIYIEDEIKLKENVRLNIGIRAAYYKPKDTTFYRIEPRVSLRWLLNEDISIKANYTQMNQYNHALVNNYQGFEKEIWLAATKDLIPQKADQVSGGIFYSNPNEKWSFSVESYYKKMKNLLEYNSPPRDEDNMSNIENIVAKNGNGKAYGIEMQIKKNTGKVTGSLNYTLSRSYRQFNSINKGEEYPFIYDRKHNISLITSYKLDEFYTLTSSFNLSSGKPVTLPVGYVKQDNHLSGYFIYDGVNNRRLPLYHRLDLSLKRIKRSKKGNKREVSFNIFNVYARQNPVYIYYDSNTGKVKQKSLFSILPTISVSIEF